MAKSSRNPTAVRPGARYRRGAVLVVGLAAASLALPAGIPAGAAPDEVRGAVTAAPALRPTATWRRCPSGAQPTKQCATVRVPMDYRKPGRGSFAIALARIPATGTRSQHLGSLLWDAGGPGGPSTSLIDSFAARVSPAVRARFDFVAFDPRGIGASTPVLPECGTPWPVRPARTTTPNWMNVQRATAALVTKANRKCARDARAYVNSMGTNNVVRDLDRVRRAVGDRKLTFWATSYGTRIGYVYAVRYPQRVRAIVMDGSIDPTADFAGLAEIGGRSQDSALRFMRRNYPVGYRAIMRTAASLASDPIPLEDGGVFSRWDWLDLAGDQLPFQAVWPNLSGLAKSVADARGTDERAALIREELAKIKARPNSNVGGGFSVVNCLDYAQRLGAARQARIARTMAKRWPVFGGSLSLTYAMGCEGLSALRPDPVPTITTRRERARVADVPVLLANATHDGSTPMAWAKRMQRAFGGRPMIKYQSGQHVIWGAVKSACVNRPIDRFVIALKEPKAGRTCRFVQPTG